ncbi:11649_t:CDS:2 [Acaulospora morrowiae]|uniref:11649_t:CDS:1 n=1 Tax=Acaulospora morrowiae TaxID=94023 RepID=A0A9N9AX56_9GLOM|nr:11649_t:CDS:2 [Acaulospora morrowiae]
MLAQRGDLLPVEDVVTSIEELSTPVKGMPKMDILKEIEMLRMDDGLEREQVKQARQMLKWEWDVFAQSMLELDCTQVPQELLARTKSTGCFESD